MDHSETTLHNLLSRRQSLLCIYWQQMKIMCCFLRIKCVRLRENIGLLPSVLWLHSGWTSYAKTVFC